jgi:hypothetical protein
MDPNEPIFALVVDPVRSNVVYVGSLRSGVFVSQDGGETWRTLNQGLHARTVHGLAIAADGQTLYAATHGDGVYRLSTLSQAQFDALAPAPTATSAPAPPVATPSTPTPTARSSPLTTAAPTPTPYPPAGSEPTRGSPTPAPTATPQPAATPTSAPSKGSGLCGGAVALPLVMGGLAWTRFRRRK